jgi:hypothetical protein
MECQALFWCSDNGLHQICCTNVDEKNPYCDWHRDFDPETERKYDEINENLSNGVINDELIQQRNKILLYGNDDLIPLHKCFTINDKKYEIITSLEIVPEKHHQHMMIYKWYENSNHEAVTIIDDRCVPMKTLIYCLDKAEEEETRYQENLRARKGRYTGVNFRKKKNTFLNNF